MAQLMEITCKKISHATIKHTQTLGMIKRSHAKLKKILEINVNLDKFQGGRYVDLFIMAHNTTYHTSIKCSPTEIFHGRIPYNALYIQFLHTNKQLDTKNTEVNQLLDKMNATFHQNSANIINIFHNYKAYYNG